MGQGDHTKLIVWQLADELRTIVYKLTCRPAFARDQRLRSETEETVSSICRNIAEGHRRRRSDREFARFLEFSSGSSAELSSLFDDAQSKKHVTADQLQPARSLRYRLDIALNNFIRHLRSRADQQDRQKRRKQL
jgi:four helix bundle protein